MSWTDERVEVLKKLWMEGLSASQIAGRLGGVSRNAVIGKVHRLGLAGRANPSRSKPSRPRPRMAGMKRAPKPRISQFGNPAFRALYPSDGDRYVPLPEEIDIPPSERVPLIELNEGSCRWPIGDPQTSEFGFCTHKCVPGLPYCETHSRRAFQPPQAKNKRSERREPTAIQAEAKPVEAKSSDAPARTPSEKSTVDA